MKKKAITKGQENIKDGVKDKLDLRVKYKGKHLDTGHHGGNFWNMTPQLDLQAALVTGTIKAISPRFQQMIKDGSIANCTKDTFQLIHDVMAGKMKGGKLRTEVRKKFITDFGMAMDFKEEMMRPGMDRKNALCNVSEDHGVKISKVEKAITRFGIGAKSARKSSK